MSHSRLGCLTPLGLITASLTLAIVAAITLVQGGVLFNPGDLNAQAGAALNGFTSHAEFGNQCRLCHAPFWDAAGMSGRCEACHTNVTAERSDPATLHGIVYQQSPSANCQSCHTEHHGPTASLTKFSSLQFPHEMLGFSLTGHITHPDGTPFVCRDCHVEKLSTFNQATCQTCHQQLDAAFMTEHVQTFGSDCLACHDGVDTFGNDFDHNRLAFPLIGKHAETACASCHEGTRTVADLRAAPLDCYSCHVTDDPHQGRFGTDCAACHTPNGWKPATFDHNLAAFKLEGKHADVRCESCHINNVFKGTPTNCYSCHATDDPHQGQFGTDCAACHTPNGWKPATFDHNLTNFPLTGAHVGLACTSCHVNNVFKGTPTACVACHAEPAFHAGLFGTACQQCHTTSAWRPAQFTGPHTFPLNHGGAITCATCHPSTLTAYTCYGCHEHDPAKIQRKHLKEGITNFTNCVSCHPTGHEHEGGEGRGHEGGEGDDD
jgi:hypothetical protein